MRRCLLSTCLPILSSLLVPVFSGLQAQSLRKPDYYQAEVGTFLSSSPGTPFWLRANQYGIVPNESPVMTLRAGIYSDYRPTPTGNGKRSKPLYEVGYGLNVVVNVSAQLLSYEKSVLLPEAYVKVRRGIIEVYVGRRREKFGLADSNLSTGSYAWSGNAMPIPKIQIAIPEFTDIGFTKGWVAVQGNYAHGFLNAAGYIQNSMLHQKSLYLRVGRSRDVVRLYGGFNHQVVWGGHAASPKGIPGVIPEGGQLPSSLIDYFYVVTGINSGRTDSTKYTYFDLTNRVGNHLGSLDVAFEVDMVRHTLYAYRQNLVEDGSLAALINVADGLNGLRLRRNNPTAFVRDILIEFLNTTSQGGPVFIIDDAKLRGRDNYFNHQQYRDGWSYRQHTIGTPFIPPALGQNGEYPYGTFTANNRVRVFHLGMGGSLPVQGSFLMAPIAWQLKLSYSQNLGTYDVVYQPTRNQFSGYAGLIIPMALFNGLQLTTSVAVDNGTLYRNGIGTFLSLRKSWYSAPRP